MIFTDYNGQNLPPVIPEIITMSNPHPTHNARIANPGAVIILRGWNPEGGKAEIDQRHKDARIFNIPTNPTDIEGKMYYVNSIFVFEAAGLCVAHLGNLNHLLERDALERLGRIDVLFVPIGTVGALAPPDAIRVIQQIRAPLVVPMHFDTTGPNAFVDLARELFPVKVLNGNHMIISRETLPKSTKILFMVVLRKPKDE